MPVVLRYYSPGLHGFDSGAYAHTRRECPGTLTFTAFLISPYLEFKPAMAHTEAQVRRRVNSYVLQLTDSERKELVVSMPR
jgi:hypothetical protein